MINVGYFGLLGIRKCSEILEFTQTFMHHQAPAQWSLHCVAVMADDGFGFMLNRNFVR